MRYIIGHKIDGNGVNPARDGSDSLPKAKRRRAASEEAVRRTAESHRSGKHAR